MNFNIKRYFYGMAKRKWIGLLIFVIPAVFLFLSAIFPDRYSVTQKISIEESYPVAYMTDPVGFMTFGQLNQDPSSLFLNQYSLTRISGDILAGWAEKFGAALGDEIRESMSLKRLDNQTAQVIYTGKNREVGAALVGFYADRLVKKAHEGLVRSNTLETGAKAALSGGLETREMRALWRSDRLGPLVYCVTASVVLVFLLFGFLEWSDSSLKSERQIARYCDLPILGNIPDLNRVAQGLHAKDHAKAV